MSYLQTKLATMENWLTEGVQRNETAERKTLLEVTAQALLLMWHPMTRLTAAMAAVAGSLARGSHSILAGQGVNPVIARVARASTTWRSLTRRLHVISTWPLLVGKEHDVSRLPEEATSAAYERSLLLHRIWVEIACDVALGGAAAHVLIARQGNVMRAVIWAGDLLTGEVLREGCVWLMGAPAGFKVNKELALVLGNAALVCLQAWAMLGVALVPWLPAAVQWLGAVGVVCGLSTATAVVADVVALLTLHMSLMYRTTALIFHHQLNALAALWRTFRGRKLNPLREREDSFECTVEQLVVGSLMFTPLLLLLPTTAIFYAFLTCVHLAILVIRASLQVLAETIAVFPYHTLALWLACPVRFPTGLWCAPLASPPQEPLISQPGGADPKPRPAEDLGEALPQSPSRWADCRTPVAAPRGGGVPESPQREKEQGRTPTPKKKKKARRKSMDAGEGPGFETPFLLGREAAEGNREPAARRQGRVVRFMCSNPLAGEELLHTSREGLGLTKGCHLAVDVEVASLGEMLRPFVQRVRSAFSSPSFLVLVSSLFQGKRITSLLHFSELQSMKSPWPAVGDFEHWGHCCKAFGGYSNPPLPAKPHLTGTPAVIRLHALPHQVGPTSESNRMEDWRLP